MAAPRAFHARQLGLPNDLAYLRRSRAETRDGLDDAAIVDDDVTDMHVSAGFIERDFVMRGADFDTHVADRGKVLVDLGQDLGFRSGGWGGHDPHPDVLELSQRRADRLRSDPANLSTVFAIPLGAQPISGRVVPLPCPLPDTCVAFQTSPRPLLQFVHAVV